MNIETIACASMNVEWTEELFAAIRDELTRPDPNIRRARVFADLGAYLSEQAAVDLAGAESGAHD